MVHDGKSADQRITNKRPNNKVAVWRECRLDDAEEQSQKKQAGINSQFGVFAGIVPRTGYFVVLALEGAVARTVHRLSEDQKWDTEFIGRVAGAMWDFKANARDDVNDGGILGDWALANQIHRLQFFPRQCGQTCTFAGRC